MVRRVGMAVAAVICSSVIGVTTAGSAQAACGTMDHGGNTGGGVMFLHWSYGTNYTQIEPHGGTQLTRAVIVRGVNGGLKYYYGSAVRNPYTEGTARSYVKATDGINYDNYYVHADTGTQKKRFYAESNGYCKPGV